VIQGRAAALRREGIRPILLRPASPDAIRVTDPDGRFPNLRFTLPTDLPALARLLHGDRPTAIEVHHLLGHHHAVLTLADRLAVPLAFHLHDYAMLCPRITLMGRDGRYCGEPDLTACEDCVADLGDRTGEAISVAALRHRSRRELAGATIAVPSPDMARRLRRHFADLRPAVLPPEDDADLPAMMSSAANAAARVCVVGGLSGEKGYDILLACARDAAARRLPLEFTLVGHTADDARLLATGRVFVTGPYDDGNVVALIRAQHAGLGWLPSVWPETWCFTLSHLWRAGLAVAAFDIGAPAERIRATSRGWLMPLGLSPAAVNDALLGRIAGNANRR
jgi:glycosyltransferase involved in cell wall biosynthesis